MIGTKHLIECRCILPQFKRSSNPILHKFAVFSVIDDDDNVVVKFVQCDNCGVIHKVVDICRSEIQTGREDIRTVITIDEIKDSIPEKLAAVLQLNDIPIATWEEIQFIIEHQQWGREIVLSSERIGSSTQGKYVKIIGESLFKVGTFSREDVI